MTPNNTILSVGTAFALFAMGFVACSDDSTSNKAQASACKPPPIAQSCNFAGQGFLIGRFVTKKSKSQFSFSAPPGLYCLKLKNGSQGYSKTSSAIINLNGTTLWRENTFNQNFNESQKTVKFQGQNNLSVVIKSGQPPQKSNNGKGNGKGKGKGNSQNPKNAGSKAHAIELWAGNYKPQTPSCSPNPNLYKVEPNGTKFEADGVKFTFRAGAVAQDTYLSVSCKKIPGAIAKKCSIEPHFKFSRGLVELQFAIDESNIPTYLNKSHIVAFKNGKQIPSRLTPDQKSIVASPDSFSDVSINIVGWYGAVTDPPQGRYEPKTWNSSIAGYKKIPGSYSDIYGLNIGISTDNFITAQPGYKDPNDHSKGWKDVWETTGKVSLCRKLKGETIYTEVDDDDYIQGKSKVEFGIKSVKPGKNLYFISFKKGTTKPGCNRRPAPPIYRTADLTVTRLVEGLHVNVTVTPSTTISYDRYDKMLDFTYDEMKKNAVSEDAQIINKMNNNQFSPVLWAFEEKHMATGLTFALFAPNQIWDHKPFIRDDTKEPKLDFQADVGGTCALYHFPVRGHKYEMYYDVWSNIHFGYVGRAAGWTAKELQDGAATWPFAGLNDEIDVISAQIGIDLWDTYNTNLTKTQLSQKIINSVKDMVAAQETEAYKKKQKDTECTPPSPWKHVIPIENGK